MIWPLMVMAALVAQTDDCPKQTAQVISPAAQAFVQINIDDDDKEALKDAEKAKSRAQEARVLRQRARTEWYGQSREEIQKAMQQLPKELEKAGVTRSFLLDQGVLPGFTHAFTFGGTADQRVTLDIDNLSIKDAVAKVLKPSKLEFTIEDGVCKDARITMKAQNIKLSTALDMITQAGGVYWTTEVRVAADAKPRTVYRVQTEPVNRSMIFVGPDGKRGPVIGNIGSLAGPPVIPGMQSSTQGITWIMPDKHDTITCPHCDAKIITIKAKRKPGMSRNDPSLKPWKFCPICGKPIVTEG